jgi:hypothetical protein
MLQNMNDYDIVTSTDILLNVLKKLLINNDKLCLNFVDINILCKSGIVYQFKNTKKASFECVLLLDF